MYVCACVHMVVCTHTHLFTSSLMVSFETPSTTLQQTCWSDWDQWLACFSIQHWNGFAGLNWPLPKGVTMACGALLWTSHHLLLSLQWRQRRVVCARTKVCALGEPPPRLCHVRLVWGLLCTGEGLHYTRMTPRSCIHQQRQDFLHRLVCVFLLHKYLHQPWLE